MVQILAAFRKQFKLTYFASIACLHTNSGGNIRMALILRYNIACLKLYFVPYIFLF